METAIDSYRNNNPWSQFGHIEVLFLGKCDAPTIQYVNGKLTYSCATEGATFKSSITCEDIADYESYTVDLTVAYHISVYATAQRYEDSETVTATLFWIDVKPENGIATETIKETVMPLLVKNTGGTITVEGVENGTPVSVYTINGMFVGSDIANNDKATITTTLAPGTIVIVRIGKESIKIRLR